MGRNTPIKTAISDNFTQLKDNVNNQSLDVGATGKLTTTVDSDIVGAINELDSDLGELNTVASDIRDSNFAVSINNLNTKVNAGTAIDLTALDSVGNDSDTLRGGYNDSSERASLVTLFNTVSQDIQKLDSDINREDRLTTTASTLRGAINELDAEIGTISGLTTTNKSTVVASINELDAEIGAASLNTSATTVKGAINENLASLNALAVFKNIATDSGSISVTVDSANDTLSVLSGSSLKTLAIGGNKIQIDHDVTGASSVNNSGNTFIQDLTINADGHVTGIASATVDTVDSAGLQLQINDLITTKQATIDSSNRLDASLIHDGTISNTEFGYLNGADSNIQAQLDSISNVSLNPVRTPLFPLGRGVLSGVLPTNQISYHFGELKDDSGYPRFAFQMSPASNPSGTYARQTRVYGGGKVDNYNLSNDTQPAIILQPTSGDNTNVRSNLEQGPPFELFYNGRIKGGFGTSRNDPYVYSYESYDAYCIRSRVNYNGISNTTSVNADGVSSVVDYGTGNFRVNFASQASAAHANMGSGSSAYSWAGAAKATSTTHPGVSVAQHPSYTMFNSYLHIIVGTGGGAGSAGFMFDLDEICIMTSA